MRLSRPLCALSVVSVLVLGVAGCSPAADDPEPSTSASATPRDEASDKDADEGSDGAGGEISADDFLADLQAAMADQTSYEFTMSMGSVGEASGAADMSDPENPAVQMTVTTAGIKMETRIVDGVTYMNMGAMSGDKFIKSDPTDPNNPLASIDAQIDQADPAKNIAAMRDAIVSVKVSGDAEKISGVMATPHTFVVDTTKLTGPTADQLEAAGDIPTEMTYTYWIGDDDGLPYKLDYEVVGQEMGMTFSNWGVDVTVVAPSEDQISTDSLF